VEGPRRERKAVNAPRVLDRGIQHLNRIRYAAAVLIRQRGATAAPAGMAAPARAWRKQRGRDGYAPSAKYRGATVMVHEPAWILPQLDHACAKAVMAWALAALGADESLPSLQSPDVALPESDALVIGVVAWTGGHGVTPRLVAQHGAALSLPAATTDFLQALARHPKWRTRIRRCAYEGGRTEGCYRYFLDRSPKANAAACSRAHAVRLAEGRQSDHRIP
jgi:hypothetical protein